MVSFPRGSKCPQLAMAPGPIPSLYDFSQPQLSSPKTNLKISVYTSEIHLILLGSLISNATSNMIQCHFTALKHKSYFIILSNNYIVCLPVHSHEHVMLKNSPVRGFSYRYWKEQTRSRALKWCWALFDSFCKADADPDVWQHSKHCMLHSSGLCPSYLLLAIKSCVQIWLPLESIWMSY